MTSKLNKSIFEKFDLLIAEEIAKMKIGGLSYALIKDGKVVYTQGFGARDLDKNLPADENTIYRIASTTKSFICTAVMILVDEGKLKVKDPVSKYLPLILGDESKPITIKHLMNHTSGVPDLSENDSWYYIAKLGLKIPEKSQLVPITSEKDFFRVVNRGGEFVHEIDQHFHYNNFAYAMLGMIITKVAGKDYQEFIKERIFDPLEMTSTSFNPEDFKDNDNLSQLYHVFPPDKGGNTRKIEGRTVWQYQAAGGIFSCIKDMSNYMLMHMNQGTFKDKTILSKESSKEMQTNSLQSGTMAEKVVSHYSPNKTYGYGYGFFTDSNFYGDYMVTHGGNTFGTTADFLFLPSKKLGVLSLANNLIGPRLLMRSILAMLSGIPEKDVLLFIEREHYKKLNGIYEGFGKTNRIKISREGAFLLIESVEKHTFAMQPAVLYPLDESTLKPMEFYVKTPKGAKAIFYFEEIEGNLWFNLERSRFRKISKL